MLPSKWGNVSSYSTKLLHVIRKLLLALGSGQILSKYIIYIFFNFVCDFCGSFPMLFPKAPAFCCKKNWTNFCCIALLYLWAQKREAVHYEYLQYLIEVFNWRKVIAKELIYVTVLFVAFICCQLYSLQKLLSVKMYITQKQVDCFFISNQWTCFYMILIFMNIMSKQNVYIWLFMSSI